MAIDPVTGVDLYDPRAQILGSLAAQDAGQPPIAPPPVSAPLLSIERPSTAPLSPEAWAANQAQTQVNKASPDVPSPATLPSGVPEAPSAAPPPVTAVPEKPKTPGGGAPAGPGIKDIKSAQVATDKAMAAEAEAQKAQTKVNVEKAQAEAAEQKRQAKVIADEQAAGQMRLDRAHAHLDQVSDAASKMTVHDMFEGRTGARVAAALFSGLGAFGSALSGGPNYALQVIDNAQASYRQRQLDAIAQANKGVENAKDALATARIEIAAHEEGVYKKLAAQREAIVKKFGATDAQAQGDVLVQQLLGKAAEKREQRTTSLVELNDKLATSRVQRALAGSQIKENEAQAAKAAAEASLAAAGQGKDSTRAEAERNRRATLGAHMGEQLKIIDGLRAKGLDLTDKDIKRIQDNRAEIERSHHMGLIELKLGHWTGALARQELEGIDDRKKPLARAYALTAEKAASLVGNDKDSRERAFNDFDLLQPGLGREAREATIDNFRSIQGGAAALGRTSTGMVEQGAAAAHAAAPNARPAVDAVKDFIRSHPGDPRIPAAMAKLRQMGAL